MQQGVNNQFPLLAEEGQGEVSGINKQFAPSPLTPLPQGEGNSLMSFLPQELHVGMVCKTNVPPQINIKIIL